jgi:predicted nucleotidyltransferase
MREEVIKTVKVVAPELAQRYDLQLVILFGSYAKNEKWSLSDIDIAISFQ